MILHKSYLIKGQTDRTDLISLPSLFKYMNEQGTLLFCIHYGRSLAEATGVRFSGMTAVPPADARALVPFVGHDGTLVWTPVVDHAVLNEVT